MSHDHGGFEAVIGLEVHCQLATHSKIFCSCRARLEAGQSVADEGVNANTCPVCTAQPGALPVLNKKAVEYAIRAGLATGCHVRTHSVFARKNYFYPDLPKGYQISQYELPLCENGAIEIGGKTIRICRIHMEEDAGKNIHSPGYSIVNLNRAGVPLVEIVSEPDLRSPEEASAYLRALYAIVTHLEICDGNLQEGNFRCDANVSVRPTGATEFGTRAEIKNVNSFKFIEKAIEFEIARQVELVRSGGTVVQETRGYDSAKNVTYSLRSKEEAHDYRYFPDPDLIPLKINGKWIEQIRTSLPELPAQKKARYERECSLNSYDAEQICASRQTAEFFEAVLAKFAATGELATKAKTAANLITGELARLLNEAGQSITGARIQPQHIVDLVQLLHTNTLSSSAAKQVLAIIWKDGGPVAKTVERAGLQQVSDASALEPIVEKVLAQNASQAEELRGGKEKVMGFLLGQVMKQSQGKANPKLAQELIKKKLGLLK